MKNELEMQQMAEKINALVDLNNELLNDENLSFKAKGIFGAMLSFEEDERITVEKIMYYSKDGRDSVRSGIRELEQRGYIYRQKVNGAIFKWVIRGQE